MTTLTTRAWPCLLLLTAALALHAPLAVGATYSVAPTGDDARGDGSDAAPWATITHAIAAVPAAGGDTILVRPGTYHGRTMTARWFAARTIVRSEVPYAATLTNVAGGGADEVLSIYTVGSANLTFDGFVLTNRAPGEPTTTRGNYIVHFQDASDVTLQNCIVRDNAGPGGGNELLKINRGSDRCFPRGIVIRGNVFSDRPSVPGADMIDAVRAGEIDIVENIFFERDAAPHAQSFITLKRQVNDIPADALPVRYPRFRVAANVFLHWDGPSDQAFIQFGEDETAEYMITDSVIENNLLLGDARHPLAAPIQLKGTARITVRANTIVGDLPGGAFAARIGTEGANPQTHDIDLRNNLWCDPTGTMGDRLVTTYGDVATATIRLDHNLFWNGGAALPRSGGILPTADVHRVVADPRLAGDQAAVTLPVWDETRAQFASGTTTIRDEFTRLVTTYATIDDASPACGAGDPEAMPATDILGRPRPAHPDIGCCEHRRP